MKFKMAAVRHFGFGLALRDSNDMFRPSTLIHLSNLVNVC